METNQTVASHLSKMKWPSARRYLIGCNALLLHHQGLPVGTFPVLALTITSSHRFSLQGCQPKFRKQTHSWSQRYWHQ